MAGLADYCLDTLENFRQNREDLETKWESNALAYAKTEAESKVRESWESETYLDITKQKVVAGVNLVNDVLFKRNEIPFNLVPPDHADDRGKMETNEYESEIKLQVKWLQTVKQFKKAIFSAGLYGEGFIKRYTSDGVMGGEYISVWDIFRDYEFDDVNFGRALVQRTYLDADNLYRLSTSSEYWIPEKVEEVLKSASRGTTPVDESDEDYQRRTIANRYQHIEFLEFYIRIPLDLAEGFEADLDDSFDFTDDESNEYIDVLVCMVDGVIIRYMRLDAFTRRPFYRVVWEPDITREGGIGIADNVAVAQRVLNRAIQKFEDNKQFSSSVILALKKSLFNKVPEKIAPGTLLDLSDEARSAGEAMQQVVIADVGNSLLSLIDMFLQFADMSSNIPRAQQGQQSMQAQTAFEIQQRLERSGKYIGEVVSGIDIDLIEPFIQDHYYYLRPEGSPEQFRVQANGFATYEKQVLYKQALIFLLQIIQQNPDFYSEIRPEWFLSELAEAVGLNPYLFLKTKEEKDQEAKARQASPEYQASQQSMILDIREKAVEIEKTKAEIAEIYNDIRMEKEKIFAEGYKQKKQEEMQNAKSNKDD